MFLRLIAVIALPLWVVVSWAAKHKPRNNPRVTRCIDCKQATNEKTGDGVYLCSDCWRARVAGVVAARKVYWEAVTPPGPSAEALWVMAFVLIVIGIVMGAFN